MSGLFRQPKQNCAEELGREGQPRRKGELPRQGELPHKGVLGKGELPRRALMLAVLTILLAFAFMVQGLLAPSAAHAAEPQPGATESFYAYDWGKKQYFQLKATCRYVGEHVAIYLQPGVALSQTLVTQVGMTFDQTIYPTLTAAYGMPPEPGIDGDPRVFILVYNFNATNGLEGFFNPRDIDPKTSTTSNRREMFYVNSAAVAAEPYSAGALVAHELAHLIVHYRDTMLDPSPTATPEALWVNEGFSTYAEYLCGYAGRVNAQVRSFCNEPGRVNLTAWEGVRADYGASYCFMAYLAEQLGQGFLRVLVEQPLDGIAGINAALEAAGSRARFGDLFADWVIACFLDSRQPLTAPYYFATLNLSPTPMSPSGAQPWLGKTAVSNYGMVFVDFPSQPGNASFQAVLDGADGAPLRAALISWDSSGKLMPVVTRLDLSNPATGNTVWGPRGYDCHTLAIWAQGPEGAATSYSFTFSGAFDPPGGVQFLDMGGSDYFYQFVSQLLARGVISGREVPEGSGLFFFGGKENVLRAQFAKMIMEATGLHTPQIDNLETPTFKDVRPIYKNDQWQAYPYDYVEEAAALGIVNGYKEGYFRPYSPITRAHLVLMIIRGAAAAGKPLPPYAGSEKIFADVPLSHPYYREIMTAYKAGIMSGSLGGDGNLYFRPYSQATRNHVAKMTANLISLLERP